MSNILANSITKEAVHEVTERVLPLRYEFLDGIRGLAALNVVFSHIHQEVLCDGQKLSGIGTIIGKLCSYGPASVSIFIVLSGYCLMLPLAKREKLEVSGGFLEFLKRRAKRILPGYYGALILSLAVTAAFPALREPKGVWRCSLPMFDPGVIISHLLLVHNLNLDWVCKLDYPLWSIATEWQIYFVFPLILLPVARAGGMVCAVLLALVLGYLPHFCGHGYLDWAVPWYVFLFALGMLAAQLSCSSSVMITQLRQRSPWLLLSAILTGLLLLSFAVLHVSGGMLCDPLLGMATCCLLVALARGRNSKIENLMRNFLEHKAVLLLGSFSYSLYLIHAVVLALIAMFTRTLPLASNQHFFLLLITVVPCSLISAWLFAALLEKPFLNKRSTN